MSECKINFFQIIAGNMTAKSEKSALEMKNKPLPTDESKEFKNKLEAATKPVTNQDSEKEKPLKNNNSASTSDNVNPTKEIEISAIKGSFRNRPKKVQPSSSTQV